MHGQEPTETAPEREQSEQPAALGSATVVDVEKELQEALTKANENYDLYLRAKAEADNIRRRAYEDVGKAHKFAIESFAEALLPVVDSLEKALEAVRVEAGTPALDATREGLELTLKQLKTAFEKGNLREVDPAGQRFDPHFHQAISLVPADGVAPNHVVTVLQKGWTIADRMLRPALVTVAEG